MIKKLLNFLLPGNDSMKDYQFYHYNPENLELTQLGTVRKTFALKLDFNKEDLHRVFCTNTEITLQLGISKVHPNDNFCKEIGRNVSIENLKARQFKLESCDFEDERIVWTLYCESDKIMVKLRTSKRSYKPHLLKVRCDK